MFEKITLQITPKDLQTTIGRTLGIYLLFIRTQRNITREQVCNETNVNFKSLDKIESGRAALTNMVICWIITICQSALFCKKNKLTKTNFRPGKKDSEFWHKGNQNRVSLRAFPGVAANRGMTELLR